MATKEKTSHTLSELANLLGARLQGDPHCVIHKMASLANAQEGSISFLLSKKYQKYLATTRASAIIVPQDFPPSGCGNFLFMTDPNLGYAKCAQLFTQSYPTRSGIHASAVIGEHCQIDSTASIGPNCVIGDRVQIGANTVLGANVVIDPDCVVGRDCQLRANVTLYHHVKLGDRVLIHSGAVLGADGFGLINDRGAWQKIPQLGGVSVGSDVEIGANTTIDRGAIDDTVIEQGVKLDNLIMVAHNVRIGAHTAIAGCVGIAGSTTIGKHCMIGGATGIADHLEICDQVIFTGNCFVTKSITKPGIYSSGIPAQPREEWQRSVVHFRRLSDMDNRLKQVERTVHERCED